MSDEEIESAKRVAKWGDSGERDAANHHVRWEDTDDTGKGIIFMVAIFLVVVLSLLFS